MENIFNMIVIVYLIVAMVMDLKISRVKNWWIIIGYILAVLLSILYNKGIKSFILGFFFPFPLLIFYRFRMIGAGDIKLLSVLGCILGIEKMLLCITPIIITSGILMIIYCIKEYIREHNIKDNKIPLIVAITIGVSIQLLGGR